jgi:hypothetical protein
MPPLRQIAWWSHASNIALANGNDKSRPNPGSAPRAVTRSSRTDFQCCRTECNQHALAAIEGSSTFAPSSRWIDPLLEIPSIDASLMLMFFAAIGLAFNGAY